MARYYIDFRVSDEMTELDLRYLCGGGYYGDFSNWSLSPLGDYLVCRECGCACYFFFFQKRIEKLY